MFKCSLGFFCQTKVHGKDRVKFMESLVVADIAELKDNQVGLRIVSCLSWYCELNLTLCGTTKLGGAPAELPYTAEFIYLGSSFWTPYEYKSSFQVIFSSVLVSTNFLSV